MEQATEPVKKDISEKKKEQLENARGKRVAKYQSQREAKEILDAILKNGHDVNDLTEPKTAPKRQRAPKKKVEAEIKVEYQRKQQVCHSKVNYNW